MLTKKAKEKARQLATDEGVDYLRLQISGGGCAGFNYEFLFAVEGKQDDIDILYDDILLVDSISNQYLSEATIDLRSDAMGESLVINNPLAQTTCGCGSSFSI